MTISFRRVVYEKNPFPAEMYHKQMMSTIIQKKTNQYLPLQPVTTTRCVLSDMISLRHEHYDVMNTLTSQTP